MFEYSNGYTTQDSRPETGSVQHSGAFDNSKEANRINTGIERNAAIAALRQNAAATMDAALSRGVNVRKTEQATPKEISGANFIDAIQQEIYDDINQRFGKSFDEKYGLPLISTVPTLDLPDETIKKAIMRKVE